MNLNYSVYTPDPAFCNNKWCNNTYFNVPVSGQMPQVAKLGSLPALQKELSETGGKTGRGVTSPIFDLLQVTPWKADANPVLVPFQKKGFEAVSKEAIFFDPYVPGYIPPAGNPRSMCHIGYEWRN